MSARRQPARGSLRLATALAALVLASSLAWPAAGAGSADSDLRARIEARLEELSGREETQVEVRVQEGQVLLRGRVRLLEQSLRAEQIAWTTPGVLDVENELRVARAADSTDDAIEHRVRMVIKGDERFLDTNLEVSVAAGVVRIRGLFQQPGDVLSLKHRIASIPGVLDLEIDALLVARHDSASSPR